MKHHFLLLPVKKEKGFGLYSGGIMGDSESRIDVTEGDIISTPSA